MQAASVCRKSGLRHFFEVFIAPLRLRRGQGAMQGNPCYARLFRGFDAHVAKSDYSLRGSAGPEPPGVSRQAGAACIRWMQAALFPRRHIAARERVPAIVGGVALFPRAAAAGRGGGGVWRPGAFGPRAAKPKQGPKAPALCALCAPAAPRPATAALGKTLQGQSPTKNRPHPKDAGAPVK